MDTTLRVTSCMLFPCALLLCAGGLLGQDRYPVRQLTTQPAQEGFPSWSPDGKLLVYTLIAQDGTPGITGLWTVPAEGGEPRQIFGVIAEHPDWSRDGHYIAFDADSGNSVKLISSRGGQPVRIVPPSIRVFGGGIPKWSPDGAHVAFKAVDSGLLVLDVRTGETRTVFEREGTMPLPGCWSRDGSAIYFTLRAANPPAYSIWRASLAGDPPRPIMPGSERPYRYVDLSPDGTLLAITWCEGRNCDLGVVPADGGVPVQLTLHPANDDTPRWSPDGTRIAFTSTREGNFDIWVMTLDMEDLRAAVTAAQRDATGR